MAQEKPTAVTWRGTTNCDRNGLAISFTAADGEIIRLHLPIESASFLAQSLDAYLHAYLRSIHSQSRRLSEMPRSDVSPHEG